MIVGFCLWWIMVYLVGVVGAAGLFCGFGDLVGLLRGVCVYVVLRLWVWFGL